MILVVSDLWLPFPGGAERLMFNLSRSLMQHGEDVQVVTSYVHAKRFDGPPVEFRSIGVGEHHRDGWRDLASIIDQVEPDVILTHHFFAFEFEAELESCGVPIVQVVLNGHRLPFASLAVFISTEVRTRPGMGGVLDDLTIYPPAFDDVAAATHGDAIGFIKPLHHKGVDLVYDLARALPFEQFVILRGEWQDIETIVDLPNVEYMEPVDDIRSFYERVRLVLVPSLSEDAGTVAQECAVNGLPCISSDAGGLVETNAGGIILDDRSIDVWVEAIGALEDDAHYASVVCGQKRYTPTGQTAAFDDFAARVVELHTP